MNAKQIWQTTRERLKTKVSSAVFTTWFEGTTADSFQDGVFVVGVPTTFTKAYLERRYSEHIRTILIEITGTEIEVQFKVAKEQVSPEDVSGPGLQEAALRPPKRSYRIGKGRLAAALQEKQRGENAGSAAAAMNSLASAPLPSNAHTQKHEEEIPQQDFPVMESPSQPLNPLPSPRPVDHAFKMPPTTIKEGQQSALVEQSSIAVPPPFMREERLNTRYTFNMFIVGKSNQLAHAASLAVAENPGRIYNPLFLYGGVGLGKTHLMHAIGHSGEAAGLTVLYVTSEKFTNEIVNAIRTHKTDEFRAKYRQIDILLVDDIQFIVGKEATEEEFFHTFNALHNANKQIVVTSDRPPKAINSLQDRLRSRFEWGLLADVQAPEYEHRLAILRSKCESLRFTVPANVIEYIARPQCSSVRELEGALNRVIAYATLHDQPLTMSLAAQALEHLYETKPATTLSVNEVFDGICRYYNIESSQLRGKQRDRDIAWPRQVAMYLMREETSASLQQIGAALGGRDHTTIMHGWEKVRAEIANNEHARQEIAAVVESLHHLHI